MSNSSCLLNTYLSICIMIKSGTISSFTALNAASSNYWVVLLQVLQPSLENLALQTEGLQCSSKLYSKW